MIYKRPLLELADNQKWPIIRGEIVALETPHGRGYLSLGRPTRDRTPITNVIRPTTESVPYALTHNVYVFDYQIRPRLPDDYPTHLAPPPPFPLLKPTPPAQPARTPTHQPTETVDQTEPESAVRRRSWIRRLLAKLPCSHSPQVHVDCFLPASPRQ